MRSQIRRKNSKFRFQLLAEFIISNYSPCKVADIGGGKGLLTYFLREAGFESWVIDPYYQDLPNRFRDMNNKKIKLFPKDCRNIYRLSKPFQEEDAKDFDLLVGLHAHGSNIYIINAAEKYNKRFLILPCCVVDEPIEKRSNINWFDSLYDYSLRANFEAKQAKINFKGQNKIIYTV